jgi:hypothetical protein
MSRNLAMGFLTLFFISFTLPIFAATRYVPDDFSTIWAALDGASNGDTIIVRDGIYTGAGNKNLDFGGKAVTLRSENGAENSVIDCQGDGRGFYFRTGETLLTVIDGFWIINGDAATVGPHYGAAYTASHAHHLSYHQLHH